MDCNICFKKILTNNLTCGNGHYYHYECFVGINNKKCIIEMNKQRCILCFQYITFCFDDVLSEDECNDIIKKSDDIGFIDIDTMSNSFTDKDAKNKSCIIIDDNVFDLLKEKTKYLYNTKKLQLYDNLKFIKYEEGEFSIKHIDNKHCNSLYTIIIFLNETDGGDLRIHNKNNHYDFSSKTGRVVIFHKDLFHEVLPVLNSISYRIKTDIISKKYRYSPITNYSNVPIKKRLNRKTWYN